MTEIISELGGTALVGPAALLLAVYLCGLRQWRLALAFTGAFALTVAVTFLAKLFFRACGSTMTDFDVTSPSGHSSFAMAFYGMLAAMLSTRRALWQQGLAWALTGGLVLAIGVSRVRLGAHSIDEVVVGWAIGSAGLAVFVWLHRRSGRPALSPIPLAVGFAAALLLAAGHYVPAEDYIARVARTATAALDICTAPLGRQAGTLPSQTVR